MNAVRAIGTLIFVAGSLAVGLAAIHFVWRHPSVIGPFALPIGMTPLVLLFEYSLAVPGGWFFPGLALAGVSWLVLRRSPPPAIVGRAVLLGGLGLIGLSVVIFVLASARYNVGMAGDIPAGWIRWVRPGTQVGDVGLVLSVAGLVLGWVLPKAGAHRGEIDPVR